MICINCFRKVDCLYVKYSNDHIRLTDCVECEDVVDKYVEFDNVLLFIDLLLLKPGAYRHLVYNSLEFELSKFPDRKPDSQPRNWKQTILLQIYRLRNYFVRFDKLNRVWILITAFEVYLTWVSEEQKFANDGSDDVMRNILARSALDQYLCFTVYCVADFVLLHSLTYHLLVKWFSWGHDVKYAKYVVSYTILLSYGAKIFPVLMLIWPYDTLLSTNIIKFVSSAYIIEALKIVTTQSYIDIIVLFTLVFFLRLISVRPLLSLIVTGGDIRLCIQYAKAELLLLSRSIKSIFLLKESNMN